MNFVKMQGAGNDFLFVESKGEAQGWASVSRAMCDRHFGAGADGLIVVLPSGRADVRMRLFNADGSEAEVSGNGVRCLVKYAIERGLATPKSGRVTIETVSGLLEAEAFVEAGSVTAVRLSMGPPRFAPHDVPVLAEMEPVVDFPLEVDGRQLVLTCLSMGNPHAVQFVEEPAGGYPLESVGPMVEHHAAFPQRVNFGVAHVTAGDRMEVRVWERGVGETLACGSGCCAAMVAARLRGLVEDKVRIEQPGGELTVEWDGKGDVYLTGPAEFVFEGDWPEEKRVMAKARTTAREIARGITVDPSVRFGKPVIKGTRVDVATVLGHLAAGDSVEDVMREYRLSRDGVLAAIGYAAEIVSIEEVRAIE